MIFLFDKFKKLKGTVRNRHTISLLYERERNGLYTVSAEIPLKITDKKTVYNYHKKVKDSDFLGHYDREGRFQLHKIASVDIEDSSIYIKGVHLFFDEAKAGAIIQERRFRGREIIDGARVAFDSIGWSVVDFDVSDTKDYIFYNVSPLEARAILVETFGFEFDYWLDFDGKNIRNKQISVKREMGKDSNKRYNYGHNVLNIKVEQDYSEIYTAVIGRGKGEDLGDDAYGRRIEYTDVEWKTPTNPMNKPKGSRTLHDENATQLFGYHEDGKVSPRTKVEIFEDIEEPAELLQASYEWLKENSVPKAVFSLKVPDGDGLDLGDKVHVIYRDIDLVKHTRVTKVIDDLVSGYRDVEFGDTAYFKTDRRLSGVKTELKRVGGSMSSRISRLKAEFDRRFDNEVQQWKDDFEQAVIDAEAAVEVMRAEMEEEFATVRSEMTERFETEKDAAYEEAQRNYDAIADRITDVIDSTREEMNTAFEESVRESKEFAKAEAEAKAQEIQSNLETFEAEHSQIISDLEENVSTSFESINSEVLGIASRLGTLGDTLEDVEGTLSNTKTQLESQISDARTELEQSISNTRTELENKINTTEQALNEVGEDLGNTKTDLQNQLDDARKALDELEIGGRNLVLRSSNFTTTENFNQYTGVRNIHVSDGKVLAEAYSANSRLRAGLVTSTTNVTGLEYIDNQEYTYSITYKMNKENPEDIEFGGKFFFANGSGGETGTLTKFTPKIKKLSDDVYRAYGTFKIEGREDREGEVLHLYVYPNREGYDSVIIEIHNVQIETGNVLTPYSKAPEDTDNKITNINQTITNIEGELSTKVEQAEVDTLKGTVTAQETLLSQTVEELSSKAEKSVVDTLTGRVANTESSVTQNAEEIAKKLTKSVYDEDKKATDAKITQWSNTASETAEGLTRVIGRVSETEKGVDTAQTRIEAEAGRIDGLLSRTSNVEGRVRDAQLAIEANADGLALRATKTEVEQAIDGIEVGSRNLIPDSHFYGGSNNAWSHVYGTQIVEEHILKKTYTSASYSARIERTFRGLEVGQTYTLTMYLKTDVDINWSGFVAAELIKSSDTTATEEYKIYSVTFKVTSEELVYIRGYQRSVKVGSYAHMDWFTLVKGTVPTTDWTPAPEDIDASISEVTDRVTTAEAELVVQAGEISQRATQSELDRVTGRVSTAETSITQNANEIARRLVKSDYDTDKAKIDGDITKWSNLTTETAEGLKQSISRLSTAEGKVTKAQADIKANADEIATKVSNSQFNSLSGKVSDNTSAITQTANEIKSKVTQAEVNYSMTHIDNGRIKTMKDVANYFNSQSSVTGALLIKTRITGRAMARVFIKGYDYTTDSSNIDAVVSFYNYSESFLQYSYTSTGSKAIERVRLFRDSDGNAYILLNDFDSVWKYPAIMVDRFDMSYSTDFAWGEGWEMSVVDSMPSGMTHLTEVNGQDYGSIVSKHETDIIQNAKEITLKASQTELNKVTGRVSTAESKLSVQAGEISSVVGKVDGNTKSISSVLQDTKSIKSTITSIEKDLASQGSEIDQALDSITSKVWLGDVGGRNLLPKTDLPNDRDYWRERGTDVTINQTSTRGLTDYLWMNRYGGEADRYIAVLSPLLTEDVVEGHEYTIQFKTVHRVNVNEKFSYVYLMNEDGTSNQSTFDSQQTVLEIGANDYDGKQIQLHTITLTANFSGRARVLIGTHSVNSGSARFYVKEPKVEKGKATAYSRAPEDFLQMSELKITPGYWQLGSTRIDGNSVSSVLRGSPDSIDAIVSQMNLTGNLNVKGQIETIAMSAVRGDFADLFAARVKAGDVDIDNISGRTAWFERLYTLNANIEKLTAQFVFTDAIHAKSLDAIEANIGRVRTAFLKADVISGTHIKSNTIEIKHLTGYDAILETLMARTVFSNEVKTLSIKAVEADIGSIRSKILTSDVIQASHIKAGTTLIDKIFSSNAMFERMMSKSAFVRTLNTVSIDTDQLTIRRADGGVLMSNGTQKFGSPIITKAFPESGVDYDGVNYSTTLRSSKTFERAYGEHAGRYANFSFRIGLDWSAKSASTKMRVVIRPGTLPSGVSLSTSNTEFTVKRGEQKSETISVRLPVPTFEAISWTLEFYRVGDNSADPITIRSERCWISA